MESNPIQMSEIWANELSIHLPVAPKHLIKHIPQEIFKKEVDIDEINEEL